LALILSGVCHVRWSYGASDVVEATVGYFAPVVAIAYAAPPMATL